VPLPADCVADFFGGSLSDGSEDELGSVMSSISLV
jgi:hypothetical protein